MKTTFYLFFYDFLYLFERERGRGRGSKSQTDSPLNVELDVGLDLKALRSSPEPKPRGRHNPIEPARCPRQSRVFTEGALCRHDWIIAHVVNLDLHLYLPNTHTLPPEVRLISRGPDTLVAWLAIGHGRPPAWVISLAHSVRLGPRGSPWGTEMLLSLRKSRGARAKATPHFG